MSLLYFIVFKLFGEYLVSGYFYWGRCIDLFQLDLIIFMLWRILRYERLRWQRLARLDKK